MSLNEIKVHDIAHLNEAVGMSHRWNRRNELAKVYELEKLMDTLANIPVAIEGIQRILIDKAETLAEIMDNIKVDIADRMSDVQNAVRPDTEGGKPLYTNEKSREAAVVLGLAENTEHQKRQDSFKDVQSQISHYNNELDRLKADFSAVKIKAALYEAELYSL